MRNSECAKPVLKLLKLFVDAHGKHEYDDGANGKTNVFRGLHSHILKTVVFHLMDLKRDWTNDYSVMARRFVNALVFLEEALANKELFEYFVPENNLLEGMDYIELHLLSLLLSVVIEGLKGCLGKSYACSVWRSYFE